MFTEYPFGWAVTGLGFGLALQTKTFIDDDFDVHPYAAMRLPYWFTIGGPLLVFLVASRWLTRLRTMRFWRRKARTPAA